MIKSGTRLQSQVCDIEVIVVCAADNLDELRCGGVAMVPQARLPPWTRRWTPRSPTAL